jgi:hypothetical protein
MLISKSLVLPGAGIRHAITGQMIHNTNMHYPPQNYGMSHDLLSWLISRRGVAATLSNQHMSRL